MSLLLAGLTVLVPPQRYEKRQLEDEQILRERIVSLARLSVKPLFIEPGSPWENGYIESFNGKMRDELIAGEIFIRSTFPVSSGGANPKVGTIREHIKLESELLFQWTHENKGLTNRPKYILIDK